MKRFITIIFSILHPAIFSYAATSSESEFVSPRSVPEMDQPKNYDKALSAAVMIGNECSGVYISNSGHILTAFHCVANMIESGIERNMIPEFRTPIVSRNDKPLKSYARWAIGENGKHAPIDQDLFGNVIAIGSGYYHSLNHYTAVKKNASLFEDWMKKDYGPPGDFAILKVEKTGTPCVKISNKNANVGEKVFSLGFPGDRIPDSPNGELWAFSKGQITRGIEDNFGFASLISKVPEEKRLPIVSFFKRVMDRPGTFAATVDINSGSSGSPVLNFDGELVGIINAAELFGLDDSVQYFPGVTQGVTISKIRDEFTIFLGERGFKEAFNCE